MLDRDDRRNCAQPCLVEKAAEHPVLEGLPWDRPPGIGGYNAITARLGSQTLLYSVPFAATWNGRDFAFSRGVAAPLLVVGECGKGRTAALATDVAPHWVGGLVDWGDRRITHVGMSLGGWEIIHSSRLRNGVYKDDVQNTESLKQNFVNAGSFLR